MRLEPKAIFIDPIYLQEPIDPSKPMISSPENQRVDRDIDKHLWSLREKGWRIIGLASARLLWQGNWNNDQIFSLYRHLLEISSLEEVLICGDAVGDTCWQITQEAQPRLFRRGDRAEVSLGHFPEGTLYSSFLFSDGGMGELAIDLLGARDSNKIICTGDSQTDRALAIELDIGFVWIEHLGDLARAEAKNTGES